jgi:DNA-directed RNA polymerase beta subunit
MGNMQPEPIFVEAAVKRDQIRDKAVRSIRDAFPFVGSRFTVDVDDVKVHPTDVSPADHKNALMHARTLSEPIRGTLTLKDNATGKVVERLPKFNLLQLPYFTDHHTFVIGGNTYNVSNQLRMKPGVYARKRRNAELEAFFNLAKGDNFRMNMDPATGRFHVAYGATRVPLYSVLHKLGVSDKKMAKHWNQKLVDDNRHAFGSKTDAHIDKLYDKMIRPRARQPGEDKLSAIRRAYDNTALDPKVTRRTLGEGFSKVTPDALLSASEKLLRAYNEKIDFDERDNLAFKHLMSVDDFIGERVKLESRGLKNKIISKLERGRGGLESVPSSPFTKSIRTFLSNSALSGNPKQINPMEILDQATRVTSLGEGGISDVRAIPIEAQRLHSSHAAVIDPVRTPESGRVGIDLRTAIFTGRDPAGNIYTVLRDARTNRQRYVPVEEMVNRVVAFPKQEMKGKVDVIAGEQIQSVPASRVDYIIPSTHALYSPAGNLIPFHDSIDGNRQTMASKMMSQALPLVASEPPLVQVEGYKTGGVRNSMEHELGKLMVPRAPTSGVVSSFRDGFIHIRPKEKTAADSAKVQFYENFPLAAETYLHHDLKVKQGDEVKAGQLLADSPFVKDGQLSLGTNLTTAYIPLRGMNSNDAIVVSDSASKKLTSQHMFRVAEDYGSEDTIGTGKHKSYFGNKYTVDMYKKLDDEGTIKPGMKVNKGDLLVAAVQKSALSPEAQMLGKLHKSLVKPFRDVGITWDREHEGTVVDVAKTGRKVRVTVKTQEPLKVGDKIAGRYGNKGVVSAIVPDEQMIQDEDGKPIDVAVSSSSVVSRINPAQVLETALAKVAKKTGKPIAVENFADRDNVKWVKQQLKKHGIKDTETVYDPETEKKIPNVLVGPQYTLKLFKTTDTNYSARGVEDYDVDQQPSSGGPRGSKGVGRLVFNALLAHDARNILRESSVLRSQKNDEWWRAYQLGLPLPPLKTTFAYDKFGAMLAGSGVKMDKSQNHITLGPLTDEDVTRMSSGSIKNPLFVRAKDLRPERGGLFDPALTGGTNGQKWSHFDLQEPVVNPVFERPVKTLLGLKQAEFDKLIRNEGGKEVRKRLSKIDLAKREREIRGKLGSLKGVGRDNAIKELKYIKTLRRNDIRPEKAYLTSKVPVVPPLFRPIVPGKRGDLQVSDANYLYRDAMLANDLLSKTKGLPTPVKSDARKHLYDAVGALYGLKDPVSPQLKARNVRGFISRIAGTGSGPKTGFLHQKLIKKRQDISGRGTIAPDATLAMDEMGMPEKMAWDMYRPFVTKGLVQRGYRAIDARNMIDDKHPLAKDVLNQELQHRPALINRAPSLYRYNVLAAYPKMVPGETIRVHEMLAPIQAGDFDGDAVQVHLPIGDASVAEARRMTLPHMLLSDQEKFTLTKAAPQQEAVTGIYAATSAKPKGEKRVFDTKAEAMAAYNRGEISLSTPVEIRK